MTYPAESLYNSLQTYHSIEELIAAGEAEGQFLECKALASPQVDKGLKDKLATVISAFANSGGGVLLLGVSTDNKLHSGLDVLTQIEPIGQVATLAARIDRTIPTLTSPVVKCPPSRVLRAKPHDTKGIVVVLVPPSSGDPVQSLEDQHFYIRAVDTVVLMPYETQKRMFAGGEAPALEPVFEGELVTREAGDVWRIPFIVMNTSTRAAKDVDFSVTVLNPDACSNIAPEQLTDVSAINPGKRMFIGHIDRSVHRGLNQVLGALRIEMKKGKRARRVLNLRIHIYCDRMRARRWEMRVQLAKKGFSVSRTSDGYLF